MTKEVTFALTELIAAAERQKQVCRESQLVRCEKRANVDRYLRKYGDNHPPLEFASQYQSCGFYTLRPISSFEQCYGNNANFVLQDGWLPLKVYRDKHGKVFTAVNPTIVAQAALLRFNNCTDGREEQNEFLKLADRLRTLIQPNGSLPYDFSWYYYLTDETFTPGWTSAMAQGQGISTLVRAYSLTGDSGYLDAAYQLFEFMDRPICEGGTRGNLSFFGAEFNSWMTYEEYVVEPCSITLNGWIYALMGLYDLLSVCPEPLKKAHLQGRFDHHCEVLVKLLPLFDFEGLSCYDLGYLIYNRPGNLNLGYHETHIRQLIILHKMTGHPEFAAYSQKWQKFFEAQLCA